jgi:hypothetical protein
MVFYFTKNYPLKSINYIESSQEELWEIVTLCVDFFTAVLFISVYTHESTLDQNLTGSVVQGGAFMRLAVLPGGMTDLTAGPFFISRRRLPK